jgi:outer membrane immunogenic protein
VAPFSWSGFYVGINGGYGWDTADLSNTIGTQTFDTTGGLVGITLGYNLQTGNWVWGLEGDIDASWLKGTSNTVPLCAGRVGCENKNTWFGTARGLGRPRSNISTPISAPSPAAPPPVRSRPTSWSRTTSSASA